MKKQIFVFMLSLFIILGVIITAYVLWDGKTDVEDQDQSEDSSIVVPESSEEKKTESPLVPSSDGSFEQKFVIPL